MQFTWGSIGVAGATSETVRTELIYQIERISHHASAVILDGCNECGGGGLTESFVMPTVATGDRYSSRLDRARSANKMRSRTATGSPTADKAPLAPLVALTPAVPEGELI